MKKAELLQETLGDNIVVLTKETHRAAYSKQEIHLRIAESLRQICGTLQGSSKIPSEPSSSNCHSGSVSGLRGG